MPHVPTPRKDPSRDRWRCRYKGKWILGRTYEECLERLQLAGGTTIGTTKAGAPATVAELVTRYEAAMGELPPWLDCGLSALEDYAAAARCRELHKLPATILVEFHRWVRRTRRQNTVKGPKKVRRSVNTARIYMLAAGKLLKWGAKQGFCRRPETPDRGELPRPADNPRPLNTGELRALCDHLEAKGLGRALRAMRFMTFTGARPSEWLELQWREVDFERKQITLGQHKTAGSTGKPRVILLTPPALAILETVPRTELPWVFVSRLHRPYTCSGLRAILRRAAVAVLGYPVTLYQLRHSFAQLARDQGTQPDELMELMGHKSIATTLRYYRVTPAAERAAAAFAAPAPLGLDGPTPRPKAPEGRTRRRVDRPHAAGCAKSRRVG